MNSKAFKILIASDVHLGHNELHPVCGDDSFRAFEEILIAASEHDVDFMLLAGDLFDKNKPTFNSISKAFHLMRKHCLGENSKRNFKVTSDSDLNLFDDNFNVKIPIFTIHGNHDDPTGITQTSVVDIFHSSGLLNYFGKRKTVEEIVLEPIVFTKDQTKIALYGLGSIHEERLQHLIAQEKFNYLVPDEPDISQSQYFNILAVHQNRVPRPNTKFLHPKDLQDLPNLVIWGHEHDCVNLEKVEEQNFHIYQPGSTVATSLCEAETGPKYYAILDVVYEPTRKKPQFKLTRHELQTVRPFYLETVSVEEDILPSMRVVNTLEAIHKHITKYCIKKIEDMIKQSEIEGNELEPLIRLRVRYTDPDHVVDSVNICSHFRGGNVAKWDEVIRFVKQNSTAQVYGRVMDVQDDFDIEQMTTVLNQNEINKGMDLGSIMKEYFRNAGEDQRLDFLSEDYLTQKMEDFVRKGNTQALDSFVEDYEKAVLDKIDVEKLEVGHAHEQISAVCSKLQTNSDFLFSIGVQAKKKQKSVKKIPSDVEMFDEDDEEEIESDLPERQDSKIENTQSTSKASSEFSEQELMPVSKPRRGRPPKNDTLNSQASHASATKKPRGRPPKKVVHDEDTQSEGDDSFDVKQQQQFSSESFKHASLKPTKMKIKSEIRETPPIVEAKPHQSRRPTTKKAGNRTPSVILLDSDDSLDEDAVVQKPKKITQFFQPKY